MKKALILLTAFMIGGCASFKYPEDKSRKLKPTGEYVELYRQEFGSEFERREDNLNYIDDFLTLDRSLLREYYFPGSLRNYSSDCPIDSFPDEDRRKIRSFLGATAGESLQLIVNRDPFLDKIDNSVKKSVSYELVIEGGEARGSKKEFTELSEEKRILEREEKEKTRKEITVEELGKKYQWSSGIKPSINSMIPGLKAYTNLRNFKVFRSKFDKAEIDVYTNGDAEASLRKILNDRWYSVARVKAEAGKSIEESSISFVREVNRRTRLSFTAGYRDDLNAFGEIRFICFLGSPRR